MARVGIDGGFWCCMSTQISVKIEENRSIRVFSSSYLDEQPCRSRCRVPEDADQRAYLPQDLERARDDEWN
jgi:hypothetical protein